MRKIICSPDSDHVFVIAVGIVFNLSPAQVRFTFTSEEVVIGSNRSRKQSRKNQAELFKGWITLSTR